MLTITNNIFAEIQQTNAEKEASEGKNEFDVKTVNTMK